MKPGTPGFFFSAPVAQLGEAGAPSKCRWHFDPAERPYMEVRAGGHTKDGF